MGWFSEQIEERKKADEQCLSDAYDEMTAALMGKKIFNAMLERESEKTKNAIEQILKYYHVPMGEVPKNLTDPEEILDYLIRPAGIMKRTVALKGAWYKDVAGPILTTKKDGTPIACIPGKITRKMAEEIQEEGICFYLPFPQRKLTLKDLVQYQLRCVSTADLVWIGVINLIAVVVGLLPAKLNQMIFSQVVDEKNILLFISVFMMLFGVTISKMLIAVTKQFTESRLRMKSQLQVKAASMMRVLSMPADFFKGYSAGDMNSRTEQLGLLCTTLLSTVVGTVIPSLFSLVYLVQIANLAPVLCVPAVCITLASSIFSVISSITGRKETAEKLHIHAKISGTLYALISGVQKLKLAGAEKRAFAKWAHEYSEEARLHYNPVLFYKLESAVELTIELTGTIVLYFVAVRHHVKVADYMAFMVSYGLVMSAFQALTGIVNVVASIEPMAEMVRPILEEVPECAERKQMVTRISGGIELNNVTFRYHEHMPYVLENLSLKIRPGQYVAIVGETGCGKSTLMRLLLGFEKPDKGAIYYDGKDMDHLDLPSLRRKTGVVLQDGKLFQGNIYSNIVISAPHLSVEEAWEAAELAGIAEDIRSFPMGMHTMISEGQGGVSGGQRQRLMIARAIAPKPKILMFDEATSALDNLTQKIVSDSLDSLKCTRIVIAHRLSTIKQCDRIIMLKQGRITEDGTFEELMKNNGDFAELVKRQQV